MKLTTQFKITPQNLKPIEIEDVKERIKKSKTIEEIVIEDNENEKDQLENKFLPKTDKMKRNAIKFADKLELDLLFKECDKIKIFLNNQIIQELQEKEPNQLNLEKVRKSNPNIQTPTLLKKASLGNILKKKSMMNFKNTKFEIKDIEEQKEMPNPKKLQIPKKKKQHKTQNFLGKKETSKKSHKTENIYGKQRRKNTDSSDNEKQTKSETNDILSKGKELFTFFNLLKDEDLNSSKKTSNFKIGKKTQDIKLDQVVNYSELNEPGVKRTRMMGRQTIFHIEKALRKDSLVNVNPRKATVKNPRKIEKNFKKVVDSIEDDEDLNFLAENTSNCVIYPDSAFKIFWDITLFLFTLYSVIITPLSLAFEDFDSTLMSALDFTFEIMFILDIFINFITGYYNFDDDDLILNNRMIALRYLKGWFISDVLGSIPSNTIFAIVKSLDSGAERPQLKQFANLSRILRIMKLFRLLKFLKVINSDNKIEKINLIEELNLSTSIKRFIEFSIEFLLCSHILSCLFIFLASMDSPSWIIRSNLTDASAVDIYVASIYFIWTTIFTIGYGDILSVNMYERVFNILIMMVGVLVYSYTVSSLGNMVTTYDKITKRYMNNVSILEDISVKYPKINDYYKEEYEEKIVVKKQGDKGKNIGKENKGETYEVVKPKKETLYQKLLKFLNYDYKMNKSEKMKFIKELPVKIRNEIIFKMYKKVIDNFTFFRYSYQNGRNEAFNSKIILNMRPLKVYLNEYVVRECDIFHEMFFVKNGVLSVELPNNYFNTPILNLRKNDHYGVVSVLNGEKSELNVRVKSKFAELFIIQKNDLVQISLDHPEIFKEVFKISSYSYQRMKEIIEAKKEKIDFEKNLEEEKIKKSSLMSIVEKPKSDVSTIREERKDEDMFSSPTKERTLIMGKSENNRNDFDSSNISIDSSLPLTKTKKENNTKYKVKFISDQDVENDKKEKETVDPKNGIKSCLKENKKSSDVAKTDVVKDENNSPNIINLNVYFQNNKYVNNFASRPDQKENKLEENVEEKILVKEKDIENENFNEKIETVRFDGNNSHKDLSPQSLIVNSQSIKRDLSSDSVVLLEEKKLKESLIQNNSGSNSLSNSNNVSIPKRGSHTETIKISESIRLSRDLKSSHFKQAKEESNTPIIPKRHSIMFKKEHSTDKIRPIFGSVLGSGINHERAENANQPRTRSSTKNYKNNFIASVAKTVKTNIKDKVQFERNPQGFIMKNFKGIFQKHINNEKDSFKEVNDKLDELYEFLTRNV